MLNCILNALLCLLIKSILCMNSARSVQVGFNDIHNLRLLLCKISLTVLFKWFSGISEL